MTAALALQMPPLPRKVTATKDERSDHVAVIERDGLRLGTAADAGPLCITDRSEEGVSGDLYRYYVREQGAPGPYQVKDPITRKPVSARDEQGRELFDLDAVAAWNASRPGAGARVVPGRPVKWSELREVLLAGARDGRLTLNRDGRTYLEADGEPVEQKARNLQRVGELVDAGLIRRPRGQQGRYTLTTAGQRWLEENTRTASTS